jgi:16S rRNA (guanine527-N7)-methyltransferase
VRDSEEAARESVRAAVEPADFQALETFVASCRAWGRVTNLVSAEDRERLWERHVADSLQLVPLAAAAGPSWIDLGSGGGFPGLVVAIVRRNTRMTLVESNRKKASFLIQAAARVGVTVRVEPRRIEALPPAPHDVVSARALAPLDTLLALSERFFGDHTLGLFAKGRDADKEVEAARTRYRFVLQRKPSRTDPCAAILAVTHLERA